MRKARGVAVGVSSAVVVAVSGLVGVVFVVFMIAGGIYRTECVYDNGTHTVSWGAEGDIPYLWSPDDNHCQAHTLTRYVLGDIGVLKKVRP